MLNKAKKVLIDEKINEPAICEPKEYISSFCYELFMEYNTPICGGMQLFVTIFI